MTATRRAVMLAAAGVGAGAMMPMAVHAAVGTVARRSRGVRAFTHDDDSGLRFVEGLRRGAGAGPEVRHAALDADAIDYDRLCDGLRSGCIAIGLVDDRTFVLLAEAARDLRLDWLGEGTHIFHADGGTTSRVTLGQGEERCTSTLPRCLGRLDAGDVASGIGSVYGQALTRGLQTAAGWHHVSLPGRPKACLPQMLRTFVIGACT